jgi:hypothetical protein
VQLVIGDVPREPLSHTRRDELLTGLGRALAAGGVCALVGGRGVGKTHLAATYVRDRLGGGVARVLWIVADEATAVVTSLADLARRAGVVDEVVDTEPTARTALRWLEQEPEPSLIVLDNAIDPDAIAPWLPRRGNAQVVITTTNDHWLFYSVKIYEQIG